LSSLITWIENFLCYRSFTVRVNNVLSTFQSVLSGVPQGSILGPLLFVVFINDLSSCSENFCSTFRCADDAKLFKSVKGVLDCELLHKGLLSFMGWTEKWGMSLNFDKCKIISFCKNVANAIPYDYVVSDKLGAVVNIEHVTFIKDLGVIFDNELSFSQHIYDKINSAYRMIGLIKRVFTDINKNCFLTLYKCMVRCHLEYLQLFFLEYSQQFYNFIFRLFK